MIKIVFYLVNLAEVLRLDGNKESLGIERVSSYQRQGYLARRTSTEVTTLKQRREAR